MTLMLNHLGYYLEKTKLDLSGLREFIEYTIYYFGRKKKTNFHDYKIRCIGIKEEDASSLL